MSTSAAYLALMNRLEDTWSTTDVYYPNSEVEPQYDTSYVDITVIDSSAENPSLGPSHQRYRGVVMINIWIPENEGTGTARTYADTIAAIYDNANFSGIQCGLTERRPGPVDDRGFLQLTLVTPWRFDIKT